MSRRDAAAAWFAAKLRVPLDAPRGLSGEAPEAVWQPAHAVHRLHFAGWILVQILAFVLVLSATLHINFAFLPDWLEDLNRSLLNALPDFLTFRWVFDWNLPLLPWLGLGFEVLWHAPLYLMRIDHRTRWYFVDADGIGSREGWFTVREKYTTWRNVQSLSLSQGPIQGLLRVGSITVRAAGADKTDKKNEPKRAVVFRDIENAAEVYARLQNRLARETARAEAGAPAPADVTAPSADGAAAAAREVLAEVRALGAALRPAG